ncbi:MAG: circularly permuted type 2 ATP-grasp protein, partial [Pseudomonadota bacterium]
MANKTKYFDEMFGHGAAARAPYDAYCKWFEDEDTARLLQKSEEAEALFRLIGVTFNVYGDPDATERLIPFDLVPRIIAAREWAKVSKGIEQRVRALNAFLHDIYHRQEI